MQQQENYLYRPLPLDEALQPSSNLRTSVSSVGFKHSLSMSDEESSAPSKWAPANCAHGPSRPSLPKELQGKEERDTAFSRGQMLVGGNPRVCQNCVIERCPLQVCPLQHRPVQIAVLKRRFLKVGAPGVGPRKLGALNGHITA